MGAWVCPALKFLNRPLPGGQVFTTLTSREIIARRLVQDLTGPLRGPKMITQIRLNSHIFKGSEVWAATKKAKYAFRFYKYFGQICFYGIC